jgi:hypothetical protein
MTHNQHNPSLRSGRVELWFSEFFVGLNIRTFAVVLLITVVLNIYFLANFLISIDDETVAIAPPEQNVRWFLSIGRWTQVLLSVYVVPQPVIPFAVFLVFCLCVALGYMFLALAHGVRDNKRLFLALPILVIYPVWPLITIYDGNVPSIGVGFVLTTLAGLLFAKVGCDGSIPSAIARRSLQVLLITFALGCYQSFALLYISICFGIILCDVLRNPDSSQRIGWRFLEMLAVISVAMLATSLVAEVARQIAAVKPSDYLDNYVNARKLQEDLYGTVGMNFFAEMLAYYSGSPSRFGVGIPASGWLVVVATIVTLVRGLKISWQRGLLVVSLLWLATISPFLLNILGSPLPLRSLFALAYVIWLMAIIMLDVGRTPLSFFGLLILGTLTFQSLNTVGVYQARAAVVQQYDRLLAADIYSRMGSADENFDRGRPVHLDVYGSVGFTSIYPVPVWGGIGYSFFDWDGGSLDRIVKYMKLIGYSNVEKLPEAQTLAMTPYFRSMPVWPAKGSVRKVNDVFLVKLGKTPDPSHAKYASEISEPAEVIASKEITIPGIENYNEINFKQPRKGLQIGSFDFVNGSQEKDHIISKDKPFEVVGWSVYPDYSKPADLVIITEGNNIPLAVVAVDVNREDIAKAYQNNRLVKSGWSAKINSNLLSSDKVTLKAWAYNLNTKDAILFGQHNITAR